MSKFSAILKKREAEEYLIEQRALRYRIVNLVKNIFTFHKPGIIKIKEKAEVIKPKETAASPLANVLNNVKYKKEKERIFGLIKTGRFLIKQNPLKAKKVYALALSYFYKLPVEEESDIVDAFSDFYKEKSDCSCRLVFDNADRISKGLQDDKDECFKKYPQQ